MPEKLEYESKPKQQVPWSSGEHPAITIAFSFLSIGLSVYVFWNQKTLEQAIWATLLVVFGTTFLLIGIFNFAVVRARGGFTPVQRAQDMIDRQKKVWKSPHQRRPANASDFRGFDV